ncbi:hypothetical protein LDENG_00258050, partial [Lucifuga dentata]
VSVIDDGLLKFSNLEELVLSANKISEIPAENIPHSLRILELCANQLCSLEGLNKHHLPRLQHLGLGSNNLGSHRDVFHLTGAHWPALVSLDLSDCEFAAQQALLGALSSLPCLRTLVLQGNPLTLTPSYPGFTVDSLPLLSYLDGSQISPEDRHRFRDLAKRSDVISEWAAATVSVCRTRGIPEPLTQMDRNTPDFPVVTYSYYVTYEFLSCHAPVSEDIESEFKCGAALSAHMTDDDADLQSNKKCDQETSATDAPAWMVNTQENSQDITHVLDHSTSKLTWAECLDFSHTTTFIVTDLEGLKRFLNRGLVLRVEEEKVLSWPPASEDVPGAKSNQSVNEKKGGKGKEAPGKSASTKDKSKDRKKKSVTELVQDPPIKRILGSVHVTLQNLLKGHQKVDVLCDLGVLLTENPAKKTNEDKKKDKELKSRGNSGVGQRNTAALKGKGKGRKESEDDNVQLEPLTVEFSVQLEKWNSASEAHVLLLPQQTS